MPERAGDNVVHRQGCRGGDAGARSDDRPRRRIKALIAEFDRHPPEVRPRPSAVVIPDGMGAMTALSRYMKLIDEGVHAQVVLQSRAGDKGYLAARGVETLIPVEQI